MAPNSARQRPTAVLLDDESDLRRSPTCPLCQTSTTLIERATDDAGDWRCVRCGQHWDAARLAAVAAYAAWTVGHDRVVRRGTEARHDGALNRDSLAERLGGTS
jgi:ribosomal protein L37AE/L43A